MASNDEISQGIGSEIEDEPTPQSTTMLLYKYKNFLAQRIDELTKFKRYQELVQYRRDDLNNLEGQVVNESDLIEAKCLEIKKNCAIESTQLSHLIKQYASEHPRDPFTEEIMSLLTDNAMLSEEITKAKDELQKAEKAFINKTHELESLAKKKRQLRDEIKQSENQYKTDETDSEELKKIAIRGKERIELEKRKLELISTIGSRMIFASGIDWFESEELTNTLLTFGENIPE